MNYYESIKNCILYSYSSNKYITLEDFISNIELFLNDVELFEKTVDKILHKVSNNKELVDEIMSITSSEIIRIYINIIKGTI